MTELYCVATGKYHQSICCRIVMSAAGMSDNTPLNEWCSQYTVNKVFIVQLLSLTAVASYKKHAYIILFITLYVNTDSNMAPYSTVALLPLKNEACLQLWDN